MEGRTFMGAISMRLRRSVGAALVTAGLLVSACSSVDGDDESAESGAAPEAVDRSESAEPAAPRERFRYPDAPTAPAAEAESSAEALAAISSIVQFLPTSSLDATAVVSLGQTGDVRHAWFLSDLLPFFGGDESELLVAAFEQLSGVSIDDDPESETSPSLSVKNHLIAWDIPAYPGYQQDKGGLFTLIEPAWEPFFDDADADIDWRYLSWGGVFIDDRELGDSEICPRGCIPALDDPVTTDVAGGDWYPDDRIVFGLVEDGEALAFPKNIAEIHEMFNFTLGDRRIGLPYCTLCGSAQAYYTDNSGADEQPLLRTSGLLSRSNKVMYDLATDSVFDTFTGAAVSGPLQDIGVTLEAATVIRSTWGEWKRTYPNTQIVAEDGGIGRTYALDPLDGRDDNGPIFAIGDADARLDVQELVVGVIAGDGTAVAFPSGQASSILAGGGDVEAGGIRLEAVGDGLRAVDASTGDEVAAHEAFWFAWSQFHPDTELFVP